MAFNSFGKCVSVFKHRTTSWELPQDYLVFLPLFFFLNFRRNLFQLDFLKVTGLS